MNRAEWTRRVMPIMREELTEALQHQPEYLFEQPGGVACGYDVAIVDLIGWDDQALDTLIVTRLEHPVIDRWLTHRPQHVPYPPADPYEEFAPAFEHDTWLPTNAWACMGVSPASRMMWDGCPVDALSQMTRVCLVRMRPEGWRQ